MKIKIKEILSILLVNVLFMILQGGHEAGQVLNPKNYEMLKFDDLFPILFFSIFYFFISLLFVHKFIFKLKNKSSIYLLLSFNILWVFYIFINFNNFIIYELILSGGKLLSMLFFYLILTKPIFKKRK